VDVKGSGWRTRVSAEKRKTSGPPKKRHQEEGRVAVGMGGASGKIIKNIKSFQRKGHTPLKWEVGRGKGRHSARSRLRKWRKQIPLTGKCKGSGNM